MLGSVIKMTKTIELKPYDIWGNFKDGTDNNGARYSLTFEYLPEYEKYTDDALIAELKILDHLNPIPYDETGEDYCIPRIDNVTLDWSDETSASVELEGIPVADLFISEGR
jgi:hypothetical protein